MKCYDSCDKPECKWRNCVSSLLAIIPMSRVIRHWVMPWTVHTLTDTKHLLHKSFRWNSCNQWMQQEDGLVVSTSKLCSKQIFCNPVPSTLTAHTANSNIKVSYEANHLIFETFSECPEAGASLFCHFSNWPKFSEPFWTNCLLFILLSVLVIFKMFI